MKGAKPSGRRLGLTGDHMLGLAGGGLAVASAAFGIGMSVHGPVASLGTNKDFTVFAQLAPRHTGAGDRDVLPGRGKIASADLDTTPTASIAPSAAGARSATILPSVTLEAVGEDSATVAFEGQTRIVRVGDEVPGAGRIVAILTGARPVLRTSRGLIVPAAE